MERVFITARIEFTAEKSMYTKMTPEDLRYLEIDLEDDLNHAVSVIADDYGMARYSVNIEMNTL